MATVHFEHVELTRTIIGCFYHVYNELGYGFLEKVYENALAISLRKAGLTVGQQVPIDVYFEGQIVGLTSAMTKQSSSAKPSATRAKAHCRGLKDHNSWRSS